MTSDTLLEELRSDLPKYESLGLIDELSVYSWIDTALKKFGKLATELTETVVYVKNHRAVLPKNFYSLYFAFLCEPDRMEANIPEKELGDLQHEFAWKERTERGFRWCSCDECCKEEFEKTVVEKFYIKDHEVRCHYKNPKLLTLGKRLKKNSCYNECRNRYVDNCPWEIDISGNILSINIPTCNIYMQYYGIMRDEDGKPIIPDSERGNVDAYILTFVKRKLFEKAYQNGDDPGAGDKYRLMMQEELQLFKDAMTDLKMLKPSDYSALIQQNRASMSVFENMFPDPTSRIKFI